MKQPVVWLPERCYGWHNLRPPLRKWLLERDFLTGKIAQHCGVMPRVNLLGEGRSEVPWEIAGLLGCKNREAIYYRHILLMVGQTPWLFARSMWPAGAGRAVLRLKRLGNNSLGELVFGDPATYRSPFEIARIPTTQCGLPKAVPTVKCQWLWNRRSVFDFKGVPVLLSEAFLPTFKPWHYYTTTTEQTG